jgi:CRISPR-associated exonuclease Cas4
VNEVYSEDDLQPISALQHLAFCERQWALIHLEGAWAENQLTAEGRVMHDRAHEPGTESRGDVRISRGIRLRALRLGLSGIADVVEFHRCGRRGDAWVNDTQVLAGGVRLPGVSGLWTPFPVEYKRGRPKSGPCDEIQLCAQALCLEEMLGVPVPSAALFYGKPVRRFEVALTTSLREETERLASRVHELMRLGVTPPPIYEKKCDSCSLFSLCMPKRLSKRPAVEEYIASTLGERHE